MGKGDLQDNVEAPEEPVKRHDRRTPDRTIGMRVLPPSQSKLASRPHRVPLGGGALRWEPPHRIIPQGPSAAASLQAQDDALQPLSPHSEHPPNARATTSPERVN